MKKGFAILLLLVLVCPFFGTKAILLHRRSEIREAVKQHIMAGVGPNELVQLSFSHHDAKLQLEWEHSREFEYRGEMYDVVKSEQRTDSVFYWCIHDKAETQINHQLEALTALAAGCDPQHQNSLSDFFDFLKSLFCEQAPVAKPAIANSNTTPQHYLFVKYACLTSPAAPPPKA